MVKKNENRLESCLHGVNLPNGARMICSVYGLQWDTVERCPNIYCSRNRNYNPPGVSKKDI